MTNAVCARSPDADHVLRPVPVALELHLMRDVNGVLDLPQRVLVRVEVARLRRVVAPAVVLWVAVRRLLRQAAQDVAQQHEHVLALVAHVVALEAVLLLDQVAGLSPVTRARACQKLEAASGLASRARARARAGEDDEEERR